MVTLMTVVGFNLGVGRLVDQILFIAFFLSLTQGTGNWQRPVMGLSGASSCFIMCLQLQLRSAFKKIRLTVMKAAGPEVQLCACLFQNFTRLQETLNCSVVVTVTNVNATCSVSVPVITNWLLCFTHSPCKAVRNTTVPANTHGNVTNNVFYLYILLVHKPLLQISHPLHSTVHLRHPPRKQPRLERVGCHCETVGIIILFESTFDPREASGCQSIKSYFPYFVPGGFIYGVQGQWASYAFMYSRAHFKGEFRWGHTKP